MDVWFLAAVYYTLKLFYEEKCSHREFYVLPRSYRCYLRGNHGQQGVKIKKCLEAPGNSTTPLKHKIRIISRCNLVRNLKESHCTVPGHLISNAASTEFYNTAIFHAGL